MMFKFILLFIIITISNSSFGQAAGNWIYNQKKYDKYTEKSISNTELYNAPIQQNSYGNYWKGTATNDTTIELSSKVLINVKADSYIVILGVSQIDETIEKCQNLIDERLNNFKKALNEIGITDNDMYVDFISQIPIFEVEVEKKLFSKTYNEVPAGFEVKKNIHIKYKDNKIVEKLLTIAANNEIYDIIKVDYIINDMKSIYDTLRLAVISNLNEKIKQYKNLGIDFSSQYKTINETYQSIYPIERYSNYEAFNNNSASSMSASKKTIHKPKQINVYYNKYPFNSFDEVINPGIIEPTVQFITTQKIKFILKKKL